MKRAVEPRELRVAGLAAVLDHQSSWDNRAAQLSHRPTRRQPPFCWVYIRTLTATTQLALSELNVLIWSKRIRAYTYRKHRIINLITKPVSLGLFLIVFHAATAHSEGRPPFERIHSKPETKTKTVIQRQKHASVRKSFSLEI